MIEVNQEVMKLNGTQELPLYKDDVNLLGENMNTIQTWDLLVTSKEGGLEVNVGNTTCLANKTTANKLFENVARLIHLGTTYINKNCMYEILHTGNVC